jgi:hypothetical protein
MQDHGKERLQAVAATLVILLFASFVHLWCAVELNVLTKGQVCLGGELVEPLPGITVLYFGNYGWGYLLAVLPAFSMLVRRLRGPKGDFVAEVVLRLALILTLIWTMGCLLAWRAPYIR